MTPPTDYPVRVRHFGVGWLSELGTITMGRRYWFRCPGCFERVAWLYLLGTEFKCRHCHRLTYRSCQESGNLNHEEVARLNRILSKLKGGKKYGLDLMFHTPEKPTRMHWKSYFSLLEEYEKGQQRYLSTVADKLLRLEKRCNSERR